MNTSQRRTSLVVAVGLIVVALGWVLPLSAASAKEAAGRKFRPVAGGIPREYIVVFDRSVAASDVDTVAAQLAQRRGGTVRETYKHAIRGFLAVMDEDAARAMSADARVRFIEQNVQMYRSGTQDTSDASFFSHAIAALQPHPMWHLSRLSHRSRADSESAHQYQYAAESAGAGVRIYVVDSGVLRFHQEFAEQSLPPEQWDDVTKHQRVKEVRVSNQTDADTLPSSVPNTQCGGATVELTDIEGKLPADAPVRYHANEWFTLAGPSHGTSVGSIAGGRLVGVARGATVVPVKVIPCDGRENTAYFVRAFDWILENVEANGIPSVVTMSTYRSVVDCAAWEGTRCPQQRDARELLIGGGGALQAFEEAVQAVLDHGVPVVASANNNARDACHDTPGRLSWSGGFAPGHNGVITVGGFAKGADERYVSTTNLDASNWGSCVDIWAPAERIATASTSAWNDYREDEVSGTSYAAPMIAGLIARMLGEDVSLADTFRNAATRGTVPGIVWRRLRDGATPFSSTALKATDEQRGSIQASSRRLAYMGAFNLQEQPEAKRSRVVVLTGTKQSLSEAPVVASPGMTTQWYGVDAAGVSSPIDAEPDGSLCIERNSESTCAHPQAPAVNTQYWARLTRQGVEAYSVDSPRWTVVVDAPVIVRQPEHRWIERGTPTTLSVEVKLPENVSAASYRWYRYPNTELTTASAQTATLTVDALSDPPAGFYAVVTANGKTATSDTAFVRTKTECSSTRVPIEYERFPLIGDVGPNEKIRITLLIQATRDMEFRWYAGNAGDENGSQILQVGERYANSNVLEVPGGEYQKVWARVYINDCVYGETATIDLSSIRACSLGLPAVVPPDTRRFVVSNPEALTPVDGSRLLSVWRNADTYSFDWFRVLADGSTLQPLPIDPRFGDILAGVPADVEGAATYRVLVRTPSCELLSDPMTVRTDNACTSVLASTEWDSISVPRTIEVFAGATVTFAFKRRVESFDWIHGESDFDPHEVVACSGGCTSATTPPIMNQQVLRLARLKQLCSVAQPTFEESGPITFLIIPCEGDFNFDITADPPRPKSGSSFTLHAPPTPGGLYTWYEGVYPDGQRLPNSPASGSPDSFIEVAGISAAKRYYVEIKNTGCPSGATYHSRSLTVVLCDSPRKRRPTSSLCATCTVPPHTGVLLSVEDDHDGTTFTWYAGTDYSNVSQPVGTGPSITVWPEETTTYWARATATCGSEHPSSDSEFFTVNVGCDTAIITPPASSSVKMNRPAPGQSAMTAVTTSVEAVGSGTLTYTWFDVGNPSQPIGTGPTYTWFYDVTSDSPAVITKDVFVRVSGLCTIDSAPVRLSIVPGVPQTVFGYTPGATIYSAQYPEILRVVMDPPALAGVHDYKYNWYRDDGTEQGEQWTWDATSNEIYVTTESIDTFWVVVKGHHVIDGVAYDETTVSKKMYVSLYGHCELPPLRVTQNLVSIDPNTAPPVKFTATCDWPGVEYHWYAGQSGDTRNEVAADLGKPDQLTVSSASIDPYWVRATLDCGAVQDSPTLTFRREPCGPTMINQHIQSVDVSYGGTARLYVDPVFVDQPSYRWYQNEGQDTPVYDNDQSPITLTLENVTKSGRYWVQVINQACFNGDDSYIATVRVASHPAITPPVWQSEIWTDAGTSTTLDATSGGAISYQWYAGEVGDERDGRKIVGATSPTFTTPVLNADAKYWVRVFEAGGGSLDSPTITVKVCERPRITGTSLQTVNLLPGQSTYLDVVATGTGLTYQWYVGGTPGDPATATPTGMPIDRLRIHPTTTTTYWVAVTGHCGTGTSMVWAAYTASICPTVSGVSTSDAVVMSGSRTTVSVAATGPALTYQWYLGNQGDISHPISGGTTATIETPAIVATTSFWCRVKSGNCSRDSEAVVISLCSEPTVRWANANRIAAKGEVVDFYIDTTYTSREPQVTVYSGPVGNVAASTVVVPSGIVHHFTLAVTQDMTLWARAAIDDCYADSTALTVSVCIPQITTHPVSQNIVAGASVTLNVATDVPATSYQWYAGQTGDISNAVPNGTGQSLTINPTVTTSYWVRVGGCGPRVSDSTTATITVCTPADIQSHSPSQWLVKGATRELNLTATGTDLTYKWYRGTKGDTTTQIDNRFQTFVTPLNTTSYWARVSNSCGSDDTETITVSVCAPPEITAAPQNQSIFSGTRATLSVTATEATTTPMTYQWYSGTTAISGATASTYQTEVLTAAKSYWVRVTAGTCSTDSPVATVSMCSYPATINSPDDRDIAVGDTVRLTVNLSPIPQQYRWYQGTTVISSAAYVDVTPAVTTTYWGEFTKDTCTARSRTVSIFVSIPKITQQPVDKTVDGGQTATLTAAADTAGVTYQWYSRSNGVDTLLTGKTGTSFTTPALAAGSTATYWVRATGIHGHTADSQVATVTWCQPASITVQPQSYSIQRGTSVSLSVGASGTNLRYQWYRGTSPSETNLVSGATSSQFSVSLPQDPVSYWAKVTSDCGAAYSVTAKIDVCVNPTINTQPASTTINTNSTATLTVVATAGTNLPLSYQWYSGTSGSGTLLTGETNASFATPPLTSAANYWVKVTSGACSTNSNTAAVSICSYPATVNAPADKYVRSGVATLLSISLSPTPQTYKWYRGAQGDRSTLLSTSPAFNVYPTVTTQYWGEFTYNGCVTKSRTVTVNVCVPTITQQPQPQTISYGSSTTLSVVATEAATYQWYRGASPQLIQGATGTSLNTGALYASDYYWVEVTGSCGVTTRSDYVDITVQ